VLEFELVIVVVSLRSETDFFDNHFLCSGGDFFLLLLLIVQELLVVYDFADRGIGVLGNHHQIKLVCFGQGLSFSH
jgi:hypothetical protein